MDSQSYKDFMTLLKSTLMCKSTLPLEFYYNIEHHDEDQYTDFRYSPLYSVAEFMGCTFKGFFKKYDSENLMIGLEMSTPEVCNDLINVDWFVSMYDAANDTFFCLGKSRFDVGDVKYVRDRIYVSFKTIKNVIEGNFVLLKWTVNILSTENKNEQATHCVISKNTQGNLQIDSSLDSLLQIISSEIDAKNKTRLHVVKKELDECKSQQISNEDKLQIMANQFHEIDLKLAKLLERISPQEPVISVRYATSVDRDQEKIVKTVDENFKHGKTHSNLTRTRSEPLLNRRPFEFSFSNAVLSCCDLKITQNGRVLIEKVANVPIEKKEKSTQTDKDLYFFLDKSTNTKMSQISKRSKVNISNIKRTSLPSRLMKKTKLTTPSVLRDETSFERDMKNKDLLSDLEMGIQSKSTLTFAKDPIYLQKEMSVPNYYDVLNLSDEFDSLESVESRQSEPFEMRSDFFLEPKTTLSEFSVKRNKSQTTHDLYCKRLLFIGCDFNIMQEIVSEVFHITLPYDYKHSNKLSELICERLNIHLYVGCIGHQQLTSWLSETQKINPIEFHGILIACDSIYFLNFFQNLNEDILKQFCIIIHDFPSHSFHRKFLMEIDWKRRIFSRPYSSYLKSLHSYYPDIYFNSEKILDTIMLLPQTKTFQIKDMLKKQMEVQDVNYPDLNEVRDKEELFYEIKNVVDKRNRITLLTDYMISQLQKHQHFERHEEIFMRKIIKEDIEAL